MSQIVDGRLGYDICQNCGEPSGYLHRLDCPPGDLAAKDAEIALLKSRVAAMEELIEAASNDSCDCEWCEDLGGKSLRDAIAALGAKKEKA